MRVNEYSLVDLGTAYGLNGRGYTPGIGNIINSPVDVMKEWNIISPYGKSNFNSSVVQAAALQQYRPSYSVLYLYRNVIAVTVRGGL
jgi:hypothetical protein